MLIIYFLLGLGIATAHSDYGVSFRAQNFDKTVQNIDKAAYIKHQREKRFVAGYFVPQNLTNKATWGNLNITRNPANWTGYPTPIKVRPGYNINGNNTSNASGYTGPVNSVTPGNTPYPGYPGYPTPNTGYPAQNTGYSAQNTAYPASNSNPGQNYNTSVTRPVYPNLNNINVRPANKINYNNSSPSGYNVQPVNPVTPGNTPYYPVPNTGTASNTGNLAPNTGYPAPNNGYPVPNTGYPASNTGYPAPNSGYQAPNSGYRAPNTGYPASSGYPVPNTGYPASSGYPLPNTGYPASSGYPSPNNGYSASSGYPVPNTLYPPPSSFIPTTNVTGFVPKPKPGFTIHDAVPRNNSNGFNNTASSENCKCNLPRANSTITKEERTMDACIIACNYCPAGMKMSTFGVCVKDLDYDDE